MPYNPDKTGTTKNKRGKIVKTVERICDQCGGSDMLIAKKEMFSKEYCPRTVCARCHRNNVGRVPMISERTPWIAG